MGASVFPLVTIGIACYRSSDTVLHAIDGALNQDWPNKEILIVDDFSNDQTADLIAHKIMNMPNIRLIRHSSNMGFAGALNTLIREARGDFFAIFDDDDVSHPERVSKQYKRITDYENAYATKNILCHVARTQIFPDGNRRYEPTMGTNEGIAPNGFDVADRILMGRLSQGVVGSCANCSRMARIEVFRRLNGYDQSMRRGEDTDFNVRFALSGGHFVGIAEPLVTQKMTYGSEKTLTAEERAESFLMDKHRQYLESRGWYQFTNAWLRIRYNYYNGQTLELFANLFKLFLKSPIKFILKLCWTIPASPTRAAVRRWHQKKRPITI